jgi:hypothetical protein
MKVRIIGYSPEAAVLTGLLTAEKQEVVWNPEPEGSRRLRLLKRRKEITLNLPWGWVKAEDFRLSSSAALREGEVGVLALRSTASARSESTPWGGGIGGRNRTLLLMNHDLQEGGLKRLVVPGTGVVSGLSLLGAVQWDPGVVEVSSPQPRLILESSSDLREFERCLKAQKIAVQRVDDMDPYRNALHILDLLALPIALCHSTLANFLSYPEGREIAVALLEEGLRLFAHRGLQLEKLPILDPKDLLQRLKRKPQEFDKARNLPDRAYGRALHYLLEGERKLARESNDRIVRLASQTGLDPRWNWAVTQKLNRAIQVGFYRDPVQLYKALSL